MALPTQVRRASQGDALGDLQREFETFFGRFLGEPSTTTGRRSAPYAVDVREDGDKLYFDVELPGFKKEQVDVTLENNTLTITADRGREGGEQKGEMLLNERRHTYFSRSFHLPPTIDEQSVEAKLADGILHLTLSKREETKPRKISVS